ncbi:GIY-YIG nuclease family protein [Bosea sp. CER48]|uniref:GIY-YIG nuclease family protein n=1 Tax=Bosea sp. CER48 TaxID=3377035 RepID=UPI003811832F
MQIADRKAATAAYKERKSVAGIYACRCEASGQLWVGRAPDLATIENRLRFTLRHGSHRQRSLQAAWNAHGPDAFRFEALERLEDEDIAYVLDRVLKERLAHWRAKLGAEAL